MYDERTQNLLDSDRRHLVRAASRLLGTADAEDAVQDAYVLALEANGPAFNTAQAWLLAVVRNLAIDRLRRRQWMQQWLAETNNGDAVQASPSAEMDAALAQEAALALQLLAKHLTPADGAAVLLHEVFEASHAEIAEASGKTEAGSRQQLRRALLRLQEARGTSERELPSELEPAEEPVFRLYLQSLQSRDPQTLWALLRQPPVVATSRSVRTELRANGIGAHVTSCVRLCVVPGSSSSRCPMDRGSPHLRRRSGAAAGQRLL